jgi:hypothetical protein
MDSEENVIQSTTQNMTDYSLYLVTDSTPGILGRRKLVDVVEDAINGGTHF